MLRTAGFAFDVSDVMFVFRLRWSILLLGFFHGHNLYGIWPYSMLPILFAVSLGHFSMLSHFVVVSFYVLAHESTVLDSLPSSDTI